MLKDDLIDVDLGVIDTPNQAVTHYLPLLISGEKDLMEIKKILREVHGFEEEDVKIVARVLSNAHFKHTQTKSALGSGYFSLAVGVLVLLGGLFLSAYLWRRGFIATLSIVIILVGIGTIMRSVSLINQKR